MLFKNILKLSSILLFASSCFADSFTGECQEMYEILIENFKKNMKSDEYFFNPLFECKTDSKGKVTEIDFLSSRNDKKTIEKALNHNTIKKL